MKTSLFPVFPAAVAAYALASGPAAAATLFADDFNRSNSTTMGATSTGAAPWEEFTFNTTNNDNVAVTEIFDNQFRIDGSGKHDTATARVGYNLDGIQNFSVAFDFSRNVTTGGANAAIFVFPRAEGAGDLPGNIGYAFTTTGSNGWNVKYYDGSARNVSGSNSWIVLPSATLAAGYTGTRPVEIVVNGNLMDLYVDGALVDQNRSLGTVYDNAVPDRLMFAYNSTEAGSRSAQGFIDNLVVVPEPSTTLLGGLAGLLLLRRRRA